MKYKLSIIPSVPQKVQKQFKLAPVEPQDVSLDADKAKRKLAAALKRAMRRYAHDHYSEQQ